MDRVEEATEGEQTLPPSTTPSFSIRLTGFTDEEFANRLGNVIGGLVHVLGRSLNLTTLDGLTVAIEYDQALIDLDRGYETSHRLTATKSHVIGVAMTPSVIRDGSLKSHIVLNASFIVSLLDEQDSEARNQAIHIIAHECAHVDVTQAYDRCFPNLLLRQAIGGTLDQCRWQVIFAVWDEYAVTSMTGDIGANQTDAYEEAFLNDLATFDDRVNGLIRAYRLHANVDQVLCEVYGTCGNLLKFAAYHLGNLRGFDRDWRSCERTSAALETHWFALYLDRLSECCQEIQNDYGGWESQDSFMVITEITEALVERAGLFIEELPDGALWVNIPYTPATEPDLSDDALALNN
ncbi:hypothetical protein AB5Q78_004197 [Pseudomonas aeruginosa]